ncbi:DUF1194 domain-containing protein [Rhizobium sp. YIM 134829]|uniref:DUF1194 domain-containing protein n=1 Tax=Rhizobium sp. YIM 134829 TaxID=3390453 RepID=UPI00397973E9
MFAALSMIFALTATAEPVAVAKGDQVDVELVLAVDMSGSMDIEEARVQKQGYIEALRHREFVDAATGGLTGRIAISYVEWAGSVDQSSLVGWRVIANAADAEAFASEIDARPTATRRGTSISNALDFATRLIVDNDYAGLRRVIDVSGDGPNNLGPPVTPARDAAVRSGVIVNGLAIMIRPSGSGAGPSLDRYYADCVIGGPGAFVLPVHQAEDFAVAIRQKLIMEVSGLQPAPAPSVIPIADMGVSDCLIGEKLRPGFLDR